MQCTDLKDFPSIPQISKNKVIESLAKRDDIRNVAKKITGNDQYLSDELYSELFVTLLKMKDEELIRLYENKQIGYWIIRILKNTFNSNSSSFHYKIRQGNIKKVQIDYSLEIEDDSENDTKEMYDQALQKLKAPMAIEVVSRYLLNLDITHIVIKDFSYEQEAGGYSRQNFSIQAISDTSDSGDIFDLESSFDTQAVQNSPSNVA